MVGPIPHTGPEVGNRRPITRAGWETLISYRLCQETSVRLWGHPPPDIARSYGWQPTPIQAACGQAMAAWSGVSAPRLSTPPVQWVVLGDPQAPLQTLFTHLDHRGLLTADGWLRSDWGLVCVGDYVDFASDDPETAGYDGVQFLSWLAAHDPHQVILLLGNHDAERVMSLNGCTLAAYQEAQSACRAMLRHDDPLQRRAYVEAWIERHPQHPPIVAAHDYRSYVPPQGDRIRRLLLEGRLRWAATGVDANHREVLITHAGVTWREHGLLGQPADAQVWAERLNRHLANAVDRVRSSWLTGQSDPVDLAPLYTGWERIRPNGGSLIHRPDARSGIPGHDVRLGLDAPLAPRSVPPAAFLIPGLHQVVGHTVATQRLVSWLQPWVTRSAFAAEPGRVLALIGDASQPWLDVPARIADATTSVRFADVALAWTPAPMVDYLVLRHVR